MSNINPPAISNWELSDIQGAMTALFDKTCVVKRAANTVDGTGYTTQTWNVLSTTTCRMNTPTGSYMQMLAERLGDLKAWIVTLPATVDVKATDLLVIGSDTLTVQTVFAPQSYSAATRVMATEIV